MGVRYAFCCPTCGYTATRCGGTEFGRRVAQGTVHCSQCAELFDVELARFGYGREVIVPACPKDMDHAVVLWQQPGACPKCGTELSAQGLAEIWD